MNRKLILPLLLLLSLTPPQRVHGQATLSAWGLQMGSGLAMLHGDLFRHSPLLNLHAGGYVEWTVEKNLAVNEVFALRAGAHLSRRGGSYQMDFPSVASTRQGRYQGLYLQVPVQASLSFKLPWLVGSQFQYVNFRVGPVLSLAVAGWLTDQSRSSHYSNTEINFDRAYSGREAFRHVRPFDAGAALGLGYRLGQWEAALAWEVGLVHLRPVEELLIPVDIDPIDPATAPEGMSVNPTGRSGSLSSLSLTLGYHVPLHGRTRIHREINPFTRK